MKVLVTGGAGFIGSNLVDKLVNLSHEVVVLDNCSTGLLSNLKKVKNKIKFVNIDITTSDKNLENYFNKVDWVFHLAGLADIVPSIINPTEYFSTNVLGTLNVLEASKNADIKKFIYAASASCYGIPKKYPTDEKSEIDTKYPYALTKFLGEQLVLHWGKVYDQPNISLRFFNTYGPNMDVDDGRVISNFIIQALKGESLTIYGDGQQTRCFCYINDLIEGMLDFMNTDKSFIGPMNVGNDEEETMLSIAEKIINLAKSKSKIIFLDPVEDDPRQRKPDLSLAKKKINWNPKVPLEAGLLRTIEYFKSVI